MQRTHWLLASFWGASQAGDIIHVTACCGRRLPGSFIPRGESPPYMTQHPRDTQFLPHHPSPSSHSDPGDTESQARLLTG